MQDIVIAGAGPYGLSVASHLRGHGVPFRIFGQPMLFWRNMPQELFLKSLGFATTIANPQGLTYPQFCRDHGLPDREPCTVQSFGDYGIWLQKKLVPQVEPTEITAIRAAPEGFQVSLQTGEQVHSRRVVVALGLRYLRRIPRSLQALPASFVSHTSDSGIYERFRGKDVVVLGAGASALEAATLLHECGARPVVLVRGSNVVFHHSATPIDRPLLERLRNPLSVVGEGKIGWVLEHFPFLPYMSPDSLRLKLVRRFLGPSGGWWLRERFQGKVPVRLKTEIASAHVEGDRLRLELGGPDGRGEIHADHVVCGTGYDLDIDRLPILDEGLRSRIARIEGAPRLNRHLESSVPGLHFAGALSMPSFGPLFRFVCGTAFAGPALGRHLARTARPVTEAAEQPRISAA